MHTEFLGKPLGKLLQDREGGYDNIKIDLKETVCEDVTDTSCPVVWGSSTEFYFLIIF
jgi:hypothetical protein